MKNTPRAALLCNMGRCACKDVMLPKGMKETLERKLRTTLAVDMHGDMPDAVIAPDAQ